MYGHGRVARSRRSCASAAAPPTWTCCGRPLAKTARSRRPSRRARRLRVTLSALTRMSKSIESGRLPPPCTTVRPPCGPGTKTFARRRPTFGSGEPRPSFSVWPPFVISSRRQPMPSMPSIITHWPAWKPSEAQLPPAHVTSAAVARDLVGRIGVVVHDRHGTPSRRPARRPRRPSARPRSRSAWPAPGPPAIAGAVLEHERLVGVRDRLDAPVAGQSGDRDRWPTTKPSVIQSPARAGEPLSPPVAAPTVTRRATVLREVDVERHRVELRLRRAACPSGT